MKKILAGFCLLIAAGAAHAADIVTARLDIKGMDCASCPLTVKLALKRVSGVTDVEVDFKSQSARVRFDPAQTQADKLAKVVTDIGYPTTVGK
ncbi:MAG: cation transporter [Betaproteobacteria bacterium]|nr:cation transporter [Betaproteobacteria bacterium]